MLDGACARFTDDIGLVVAVCEFLPCGGALRGVALVSRRWCAALHTVPPGHPNRLRAGAFHHQVRCLRHAAAQPLPIHVRSVDDDVNVADATEWADGAPTTASLPIYETFDERVECLTARLHALLAATERTRHNVFRETKGRLDEVERLLGGHRSLAAAMAPPGPRRATVDVLSRLLATDAVGPTLPPSALDVVEATCLLLGIAPVPTDTCEADTAWRCDHARLRWSRFHVPSAKDGVAARLDAFGTAPFGHVPLFALDAVATAVHQRLASAAPALGKDGKLSTAFRSAMLELVSWGQAAVAGATVLRNVPPGLPDERDGLLRRQTEAEAAVRLVTEYDASELEPLPALRFASSTPPATSVEVKLTEEPPVAPLGEAKPRTPTVPRTPKRVGKLRRHSVPAPAKLPVAPVPTPVAALPPTVFQFCGRPALTTMAGAPASALMKRRDSSPRGQSARHPPATSAAPAR